MQQMLKKVYVCGDSGFSVSPSGLERMHNEDGQWVVAKYLCNVEKSAFDLSKGRHVVRIRLFWESGSQHEDFCRLSTLLLNEVMKLHLAA